MLLFRMEYIPANIVILSWVVVIRRPCGATDLTDFTSMSYRKE